MKFDTYSNTTSSDNIEAIFKCSNFIGQYNKLTFNFGHLQPCYAIYSRCTVALISGSFYVNTTLQDLKKSVFNGTKQLVFEEQSLLHCSQTKFNQLNMRDFQMEEIDYMLKFIATC